jgi:hypothetical protein
MGSPLNYIRIRFQNSRQNICQKINMNDKQNLIQHSTDFEFSSIKIMIIQSPNMTSIKTKRDFQ